MKLQPPPICAVHPVDTVFAPRQAKLFDATLPRSLEQCRVTGRFDAFRLNWKPGMPNRPHIFWDSDVAKVLEGVAYALMLEPDHPGLAEELDRAVDLILSSQQPDGYLNSYFSGVEPEHRWCNLYNWHELYCAGHLIEAAVAHYKATGNRKFLDGLRRYADLIAREFGPGENQRKGYPGHEELELALCKLADATGDPKYLELARFFLDRRGTEPNYFLEEAKRFPTDAHPSNMINRQAHQPVREQRDAVGHAVRALYLYIGMVDVADATGDSSLLEAAERLFESVAERRMYLTGGVGSTPIGEAFTEDWNLPNDTSYAESCASMALVLLAVRLYNLTGKNRYADVLEQTLYNGALSGISLSGDRYFYANLLEVSDAGFFHGNTLRERQPWFGCSCCPTSFCRFLPQIGSFLWSAGNGTFRLNIPAANIFESGGVRIRVGGDYPYGNVIPVTIEKGGSFRLALRIPGWCRNWSLSCNGEPVNLQPEEGTISIERDWNDGDQLRLELEMPVEPVYAHPKVAADAGRFALIRGPLVYALESVDNPASPVRIAADPGQEFRLVSVPGLPGVTGIAGACAIDPEPESDALYRRGRENGQPREAEFLAIPYALWQNRGPSEMSVWIRKR